MIRRLKFIFYRLASSVEVGRSELIRVPVGDFDDGLVFEIDCDRVIDFVGDRVADPDDGLIFDVFGIAVNRLSRGQVTGRGVPGGQLPSCSPS